MASAPVGSGRVQFTETTIRGHLVGVESTSRTTGQLGHVHIVRELIASEVEHLVRGLVLSEQVDSRREGVLVLVHHMESDGATISDDTRLRVVGNTLHDAVLLARLGVGASSGVGRTAPVTAVVLRVVDLVNGMVQRVEHEPSVLLNTAAIVGALPGQKLGVVLWDLAGMLSRGESQQS